MYKPQNRPLILASTSPFRQQILQKIHVDFECAKPNVDETPLANETATALVQRLALAKAKACEDQFNDHLIIGGDQVAVVNGEIVGKPHNFENAFAQLKRASGQTITFYTGLCLYNSGTKTHQVVVEPFHVHFRQLTDEMITGYLETEQPYSCAGSFKSEGLGIALFERLEGKDPNTLIGLPLITLIDMLNKEGINLLAQLS
ncbi:Maf-like protein [Psychrobium sp. MM17-31]|uniref:Maf family protein n=1 Tax=Psychrobium sp. MM17-31 TaxID=2917758 RepID=UPI001EF5E596|nr:nucleoside triphosphate pyrophosphatase [Psychrobium sp. MM17-31]MCG7532123.1 Maf-like protein [Psychrobium sp. MM17-31]